MRPPNKEMHGPPEPLARAKPFVVYCLGAKYRSPGLAPVIFVVLREEAVASDSTRRFELEKAIEHAKAEIEEFKHEVSSNATDRVVSDLPSTSRSTNTSTASLDGWRSPPAPGAC